MKETRRRVSARRILVPLDGSARAEAVLDHLGWLASPRRTELRLLRVVAPVKPAGLVRSREAAAYRVLAQRQRDAEEYLRRVQRRLARRGIRAEIRVRAGAPAEEIVALADTHDVDLILMSTRGRGGLRRLLLGSVAESVLRKSPVPIVLVRGERGRERPGGSGRRPAHG